MTKSCYLLILTALFMLWSVALAIEPRDRAAWLLQNIGVLTGVIALAASRRRMTFSRVSYTLIFLFLCLLEVGAHYTYPHTPYDRWFATLTGHSFNAWVGWERNNFDRVVHFAYGFLLAYPAREIFLRVTDVRGFWGYFLPLDVVMSTSLIFELVEWTTAELFGGGSQGFIGTQGDVWDTHKDMALASLGALLAMGITALVNARYQRDFAREWTESLRVKRKEPTDPDGIAWLARKKR
jgi:putative membrane protein